LPRAVARKATPEELSGATFTVNNIGALGSLMGTSIIPYGTTAILSVGRAVEKAVVRDGSVAIAPVLEVSLAFDHRAIDGGLAQRFMARIRENLEEPVKALL
jgi:pyruvate/2-oxoglutarate dehydrogenase complex dihydrolipoamide acyltransferase (E2) component